MCATAVGGGGDWIAMPRHVPAQVLSIGWVMKARPNGLSSSWGELHGCSAQCGALWRTPLPLPTQHHLQGRRSAHGVGLALAMMLAAIWSLAWSPGYAQEPHRNKVPGLDKITSGSSHLAFSGNIQSLDKEHDLLNVGTIQGGDTEVFTIRRGLRVSAANGSKLKLDALKPGTNVIVYYEQRGEKRTVREIIVLSSGAGSTKPARPS
jgi:hypothetical protein